MKIWSNLTVKHQGRSDTLITTLDRFSPENPRPVGYNDHRIDAHRKTSRPVGYIDHCIGSVFARESKAGRIHRSPTINNKHMINQQLSLENRLKWWPQIVVSTTQSSNSLIFFFSWGPLQLHRPPQTTLAITPNNKNSHPNNAGFLFFFLHRRCSSHHKTRRTALREHCQCGLSPHEWCCHQQEKTKD